MDRGFLRPAQAPRHAAWHLEIGFHGNEARGVALLFFGSASRRACRFKVAVLAVLLAAQP